MPIKIDTASLKALPKEAYNAIKSNISSNSLRNNVVRRLVNRIDKPSILGEKNYNYYTKTIKEKLKTYKGTELRDYIIQERKKVWEQKQGKK